MPQGTCLADELGYRTMTNQQIPSTDEDRLFRRHVERMIRGAKNHIVVISGELAAYDFPELQAAAHDAASRGVRIEVYANEPREDVVQRLRQAGAVVSIGSVRARDHYMAVDDSHVIVSEKTPGLRPTPRGTRRGEELMREPEMAKAVADYFQFLNLAAAEIPLHERLDGLLQMVASDPVLRRKIPLAENLLSSTGMPVELAAALITACRARLGLDEIASKEWRGTAGDTILLNEVAMLATAMMRGQELGDPLAFASFPGGTATRADAERARRFIHTPVSTELFPR